MSKFSKNMFLSSIVLCMTMVSLQGMRSQLEEEWHGVDLFETPFHEIAEHVKRMHYLKPYPETVTRINPDEWPNARPGTAEKYNQTLSLKEARVDLDTVTHYTTNFAAQIIEYNKTMRNSDSRLDIIRTIHGGCHVFRVSLLVEFLIKFYQKHWNYFAKTAETYADASLLEEAEELLNSNKKQLLLKIVALFHDAGRLGEGRDWPWWEKAGSELVYRFLKNNGINEEDAQWASSLIPYVRADKRSFAKQILTSGDTIDIIRIRGYNGKKRNIDITTGEETGPEENQYGYFSLNRLAPYQHFINNNMARIQLEKFIRQYRIMLWNQGDIWFPCPIIEFGEVQYFEESNAPEKIFRSEFIASEHYLSELPWYLDRSFNYENKVSLELDDDCYNRLLADFSELLVVKSIYQ